MPAVLLMILGVICILYCIGLALFGRYGTSFFLIWGAGGILLLLLGALFQASGTVLQIPLAVKIGITVPILLCLILFCVVEGMILSCFSAEGQPGADYVIVLGAQMKENGPSDVLERRLKSAISYLEANPDAKVIVSGGKGQNESISEAQGMAEYLMQAGIAEERILKEEASANTTQNLRFSGEFLDKKEDSVVVITNNFHVFRALQLAKKAGYENVTAQAADAYPFMLPNNLLREFFGVIKDWFCGNL